MFRLFFLLTVAALSRAQDVVITIDPGPIRGTTNTTAAGTQYVKFLGIPTATPPLGDLRYELPQLPESWTEVRDALQEGPQCMQQGVGSEDCLYLNLFIPGNGSVEGAALPVIVWVHGGGFSVGESSTSRYAPDYFMDQGVILITFNYRLGAIGFLGLDNLDIPGNKGLDDILWITKWINGNTGFIGADPNRVFLFGQGAGATSAAHLFLSSSAAGFISGVILDSGDPIGLWGLVENPRERALRLLSSLGFQSDNDTEIYQFLLDVDAAELTADDSRALSDLERRLVGTLPFGPVIEPVTSTPLITVDPATILRNGSFNQVPIIVGLNSAEGSAIVDNLNLFEDAARVADLTENFTLLIGSQLPLPTEEERTAAAQSVEQFYFGETGFNIDNRQAVYDLFTDLFFLRSIDAFVSTVASVSDVPIYYYYFDYDGTGYIEYGSPHGQELSYIFLDQTTNQDPASSDAQTAATLTQLWTNFAKFGNPAPDGTPVAWSAFTAADQRYLGITAEWQSGQNLLQQRRDFWRQLIPF